MHANHLIIVITAFITVFSTNVSGVCYQDQSQTNSCPQGWVAHAENCYKFVNRPRETRVEAKAKCSNLYGTLVRVADLTQHKFFDGWMGQNVVNKSLKWYTSGMMSPKEFGRYQWEGYSTELLDFNTELSSLWQSTLPRPDQETSWPKDKKYIAYGTNGRSYGFYLVTGDLKLPYICEIKKTDIAKAGIETRNYKFGVTDVNNIPLAPCFTVEPKNYLYYIPDQSSSTGSFEKNISPGENIATFTCNVVGNPRPTYQWYTVDTTSPNMPRTAVNPLDPKHKGRFSVTDGSLTINFPEVTDPSGKTRYQCEASNRYGKVLSDQAALTFGQMARFSNTPRSVKTINKYQMAALSCDPPAKMKPVKQIGYSFFQVKAGRNEPLYPSTRPLLFVSQGGVLYFSAVTEEDDGQYVCTVRMKGSSGGSSQQSPAMTIKVVEGGSNVQHVQMHTGFPQMFPQDAFRGDNIRIECFADGNALASFTYSWKKIGGQLSSRASYENLNRVIVIRNAQAEDEGEYECKVTQPATSGDAGGTATGRVTVSLNAVPYFVTPLDDQYVDKDQTVKLVCEGSGKPAVDYAWYRGAAKLTSGGKYAITSKTGYTELAIAKIQEDDSGSYGCEIKNNYGVAYSYAWIKVTSFAPNFGKYPLENMEGMIGQNLIYQCRAEGSPEPAKTWYLNGTLLTTQPVYFDPSDGLVKCKSKHCIYRNGNLMVTKLASTDTGNYTCDAKNSLGSARSSAFLQVMPAPKWTLQPENRQILINTTVDIPCLAQSAAHLDINYAWFFEKHRLRFDRLDLDARRYDKAQLLRPYGRNFGSLRIENVQFENEGRYECRLSTPIGTLSKKAWIRVAGPPGPCAGVEASSNNGSFVTVKWMRGSPHHSPISSYTIEAATVAAPDNWTVAATFPEPDATKITDTYKDRRETRITGLAANTNYYVRVRATNDLGTGEPSPSSKEFTTAAEKPVLVPQNITGGGGKQTTLVVRWNAIPKAYYNGPGFRYLIRYRKLANSKWELLEVTPEKAQALDLERKFLQTTITLPEDKNNYLLYTVSVGSLNNIGYGPNSTDVQIRSAEAVPTSTPSDVVASSYNSTALMVRWTRPKPNTGEGMIEGYRIVYWPRQVKCNNDRNRNRVILGVRQTIFGDVSKGLIIGLFPDQYYCIVAQVFNQAGDGPESGVAEQTTFKNRPMNFPTLVKLSATGQPNEIKVNWVGIFTKPNEESLDGYAIRYWLTGAPINRFKDVNVGLKTFGYLTDIPMNTRFNVRVYGYSRGGVGEMSSPMIQFMLQPAAECVPGIWEAPDMRYEFFCSSCRLKISTAVIVMSVLLSFLMRFL